VMDKTERFDWAKPGDNGKYQRIPVGDLKLDFSYQRNVVSEPNTLAIARRFDWLGFGVLVVMRRQDGRLFVVDGQQRLSATQRRKDIQLVPCLVFESDGPKHEAKAFAMLNLARTRVSAVARFRARSMAGELPEKDIQKFLDEMGLSVEEHGRAGRSIDSAATLVRLWTTNEAAVRSALAFQFEMNQNLNEMSSAVFKGLWYLFHLKVTLTKDHLDGLARRGGEAFVLRNIREVQIEMDCRNVHDRICGMGVVRAINSHRRNGKLQLPSVQV